MLRAKLIKATLATQSHQTELAFVRWLLQDALAKKDALAKEGAPHEQKTDPSPKG